MGRYVTAKFEKRDVIIARLQTLLPGVEAKIAKVQIEGARAIAEAAAGFAPVNTGRYRASLHADLLANHPEKVRGAKVAGQTKDPNAAAVFGNYIWRFLEFGTVKMAAQPHIMPAYRGKMRLIRRRMADAVNKAVRAALKGPG